MVIYVPGTEEKDPKKQNMSLQQIASATSTAIDDIATNTADIAAIVSAGIVTSIDTATGAITFGNGLARTSNAIRVSLTTATDTLGSDTAISNSGYTDGPSMAQGTSGTWFASGTVTFLDTVGNGQMSCKLWDGTTVISSARTHFVTANVVYSISLSGFLATPAANIRMSCTTNAVGATSTFKFNSSGNSKDCTISGVRIA